MLRIIVVSFTLLALGMSAWAQDERTKSAAYLEAQNALIRARQQQRRDMLHEALKAQQVEAPTPERNISTGAQDERTKSAAYLEAQNALIRARQQLRRDMLREALKSQQVDVPPPVRQMTAQEKAELRQQLRQQRQDLVSKDDTH
jgi:hypothetical protein